MEDALPASGFVCQTEALCALVVGSGSFISHSDTFWQPRYRCSSSRYCLVRLTRGKAYSDERLVKHFQAARDLATLEFQEAPNPRYRSRYAAPMKLFAKDQVQRLALEKHGSYAGIAAAAAKRAAVSSKAAATREFNDGAFSRLIRRMAPPGGASPARIPAITFLLRTIQAGATYQLLGRFTCTSAFPGLSESASNASCCACRTSSRCEHTGTRVTLNLCLSFLTVGFLNLFRYIAGLQRLPPRDEASRQEDGGGGKLLIRPHARTFISDHGRACQVPILEKHKPKPKKERRRRRYIGF